MTITAAADGSSLGNPGPAGWAWYVDEDTWDAGGWPTGTNNLGELTAILRLLEATAETGEELHILADSQYAINVVSKWRLGWKKRGWTKADKKPIKNLELIQEIDRAMEGRRVTFEWVKGHAGHRMNERADDLARACAEAYQAGRTPEPGPGFGGGGARVSTSATQANEGEADAPTASPSATPHDATAADAPATVSSSRGSSTEDTAPSSSKPAQPQGIATSDVPATESPSRSASTNDAGPATTASAAAPAFRSHPSVFSVSTQARGPAEEATASSMSEASESAASVSTTDALSREREFILAWTGGDEEALAAMTDARTTRIWPGGAATTTLGGPSPASPSVGRIDVQDLGGAFLTRYRVRWEGGASLESSVWAPATSGEARLVMVHHQSTLIG
nr:ribonuclease H [uncultured Actinomyces sp.]